MENQSMCIMSANVISPYNHIILEFVRARKQGNQSFVCLHDPHVRIPKGILSAEDHGSTCFTPLYPYSLSGELIYARY